MSTMTEDFRDHVRKTADGYVSTLENLWERIDADDRGEGNDHQEPRDELDELPLEVVWEKGEPFAVVLGTGGPHVEITGGGRSGGYVLTAYWGSTPETRRGDAIARTGEYFREYVEEAGGTE